MERKKKMKDFEEWWKQHRKPLVGFGALELQLIRMTALKAWGDGRLAILEEQANGAHEVMK